MRIGFIKFLISILLIIFIFGVFSRFTEADTDNKQTDADKDIQIDKEPRKKGNILDPEAPIDKTKLLEEIKGKDCSDTLRIGEEYNGQKKYNEGEFIFQQMVNRFNKNENNFDCYWSFYYLEFLYSLNADFENAYNYCKHFYTIDDHHKTEHDDEKEMKEYECDIKGNFINDLWSLIPAYTRISEHFLYSEDFIRTLNNINSIVNQYESECPCT
ncbi:MAG: hypothetical protein JW737_09150, partial [Acidobacteria bacterium]|nr:hypothetical protein [Acidobacteriota bacterium]